MAKKYHNYGKIWNAYLINRYPIMATYAYAVAKKCGFNENLAKSLAIGVATYYAILKNIGIGRYGKARKEGKGTLDDYLIDTDELKKIKYIDFCGGTFAIKGGKVIGIATIRGRQSPSSFYPEKFDWQVRKLEAVKKGYFNLLVQKWEEIIKEYDLEQLKNGRLFFQVWQKWRDKLRTADFIKGRL